MALRRADQVASTKCPGRGVSAMGSYISVMFVTLNWIVWLVFVFLGGHSLGVLYEARNSRAKNLALAEGLRALDKGVRERLNANNSAPTEERLHAAQSLNLGEIISDFKGPQEACRYAMRGHESLAFEALNRWLVATVRDAGSQTQYAIQAQRLGLLGTVLGVWQGFMTGDGTSLSLRDLGFSMGTTVCGLTIAAVIDVAIYLIYAPSCTILSHSAAEVVGGWLSWQQSVAGGLISTVRVENSEPSPSECLNQVQSNVDAGLKVLDDRYAAQRHELQLMRDSQDRQRGDMNVLFRDCLHQLSNAVAYLQRTEEIRPAVKTAHVSATATRHRKQSVECDVTGLMTGDEMEVPCVA